MAKLLCRCGTILRDDDPDESYVMNSWRQFDAVDEEVESTDNPDVTASSLLFGTGVPVRRCPVCGRLWVFWGKDGFATEYVPQAQDKPHADVRAPEKTEEEFVARFFRSYGFRPDGTRFDGGLYRRESEDDTTRDAVFKSDRKWHFTRTIEMSLKGYNDTDLREISEADAAHLLEEIFGDASLVNDPTTIDVKDDPAAK